MRGSWAALWLEDGIRRPRVTASGIFDSLSRACRFLNLHQVHWEWWQAGLEAQPPVTRLDLGIAQQHPLASYISIVSQPCLQVYEAELSTKGEWYYKRRALHRWILLFFIGACTGLNASFLTWTSRLLTSWKFNVVDDLINKEQAGAYCNAVSRRNCAWLLSDRAWTSDGACGGEVQPSLRDASGSTLHSVCPRHRSGTTARHHRTNPLLQATGKLQQ